MPCPRCPCPDICLARREWCDEWVTEDPPSPIKIRAIIDRSRIEAGLPTLNGPHRDTVFDGVTVAGSGRSMPPLATQAAGLARSLWDWAVSGFSMASHGEVARRQSICAACPRWDAAARKCILCGCRTDYKTAMRTEHCPEGRW